MVFRHLYFFCFQECVFVESELEKLFEGVKLAFVNQFCKLVVFEKGFIHIFSEGFVDGFHLLFD